MMKKKDSVKNLLIKEMFSKFNITSPKTIGVEIELPVVSIEQQKIEMSNMQKRERGEYWWICRLWHGANRTLGDECNGKYTAPSLPSTPPQAA